VPRAPFTTVQAALPWTCGEERDQAKEIVARAESRVETGLRQSKRGQELARSAGGSCASSLRCVLNRDSARALRLRHLKLRAPTPRCRVPRGLVEMQT